MLFLANGVDMLGAVLRRVIVCAGGIDVAQAQRRPVIEFCAGLRLPADGVAATAWADAALALADRALGAHRDGEALRARISGHGAG